TTAASTRSRTGGFDEPPSHRKGAGGRRDQRSRPACATRLPAVRANAAGGHLRCPPGRHTARGIRAGHDGPASDRLDAPRGDALMAFTAPGPVTRTWHGLVPLRGITEAEVAGPGAVNTARSQTDIPSPSFRRGEGGAAVVPPEPGEGAPTRTP